MGKQLEQEYVAGKWKNNNPGNLRNDCNNWAGKTNHDLSDPYARFVTDLYGTRALIKDVLINLNHGTTVRELITKFAPPTDNNPTEQYIKNVAEWICAGEDQKLGADYPTLKALVFAIVRQEQGNTALMDTETFEAAYRMLGMYHN